VQHYDVAPLRFVERIELAHHREWQVTVGRSIDEQSLSAGEGRGHARPLDLVRLEEHAHPEKDHNNDKSHRHHLAQHANRFSRFRFSRSFFGLLGGGGHGSLDPVRDGPFLPVYGLCLDVTGWHPWRGAGSASMLCTYTIVGCVSRPVC